MIASHLVGVWLLTATWVHFTPGQPLEVLSEPLEIKTFDTRDECAADINHRLSFLKEHPDFLDKALGVMPGANAIKFACEKQATEM